MTQGTSLNELADLVMTHMAEVATLHGLSGPRVQMENMYFSVRYFAAGEGGPALGLELLVEFNPFFVYPVLFRVGPDGEPSPGFNTDKRRVWMYLQEAFEEYPRRRIPWSEEWKRLGRDYRNCARMVDVVAGVLRTAWPELRRRTPELFPGD